MAINLSVSYYSNGNKREIFWHKGSLLHNEQGKPALKLFNEDGPVSKKEYYFNNQLHRCTITKGREAITEDKNNKPTHIRYFPNSKIIETEIYFNHGLEHRCDKPAHIRYFPNSTIAETEIYFNN